MFFCRREAHVEIPESFRASQGLDQAVRSISSCTMRSHRSSPWHGKAHWGIRSVVILPSNWLVKICPGCALDSTWHLDQDAEQEQSGTDRTLGRRPERV